eukprot:jgi/Chlat1/8100/Chrsp75S09198
MLAAGMPKAVLATASSSRHMHAVQASHCKQGGNHLGYRRNNRSPAHKTPLTLSHRTHSVPAPCCAIGKGNEDDADSQEPAWFMSFRQNLDGKLTGIDKRLTGIEQRVTDLENQQSALVTSSAIMAEAALVPFFVAEVEDHTKAQCLEEDRSKFTAGKQFHDIDSVREHYTGPFAMDKDSLVTRLIESLKCCAFDLLEALRVQHVLKLLVDVINIRKIWQLITRVLLAQLGKRRGLSIAKNTSEDPKLSQQHARYELPDLSYVDDVHQQLQDMLDSQGLEEVKSTALELQDLIGPYLIGGMRRTLERFVYTRVKGEKKVADPAGAALSAVMWVVAQAEQLNPNVSGQLEINAAGGVLVGPGDKHWLAIGEAKSSYVGKDQAVLQLRTSLNTVQYILEACGAPQLQPVGIVLLRSLMAKKTPRRVNNVEFRICQFRPNPPSMFSRATGMQSHSLAFLAAQRSHFARLERLSLNAEDCWSKLGPDYPRRGRMWSCCSRTCTHQSYGLVAPRALSGRPVAAPSVRAHKGKFQEEACAGLYQG